MIALAADIGGTVIKLGIVEDGRVLARDQLDVASRSRLLAPLLAQMADHWRKLLDRPASEADAVTLAFAGAVDVRSRRVEAMEGKYEDGPNLDLVAWAKCELNLPLWIDNDARAALIGEWKAGAGQGESELAMMTLGTGVGGAALVDNVVLRGSHGMSGLLGGHLIVDMHGRRCLCGNKGCAEAEASTSRLPQIVQDMTRRHGLTPTWPANAKLNYAMIFQRAAAGDVLAIAVRDHSLQAWSAAAVNLIHAYGARRLVIGGGIAHGSPQIVDAIRDYVDEYAWTPWGGVTVCLSQLSNDAALVGCSFLPQT
ncbi:MAG: ROK family protein [Phycisphaeraceae bacterium]|nr:ROK family protein [Phycisphaeraceae bacterium]